MGISEIVTLIVALGGLLTGVLALRNQRAEGMKLEAEAKKEKEASNKIAEEIKDVVWARSKLQLDELRTCITDLEDAGREKDKRICILESSDKKKTEHIEEQDKLISTLRTQLKRTDTLQRKRIRELEEENAELKERVEKLEKGDTGPLG